MTNTLNLNQLPPLSLYIHMPWCIEKCPYCDFNSHKLKDNLPEKEYIDCLLQDFDHAIPLIWGRSIQTIFIGGGTPSLFSGESIDYLLSQLRSRVRISPFAEISLEANPGTVEKKFIPEYKMAGVNRISLGIQSFNDAHLKTLGRIHNSHEAIAAIEVVKNSFSNFNLDIIYGLPNQTLEQARADIKTAIQFLPSHISAYNLTIEPNTHFAKFIPENLPDNDLCFSMQDMLLEELENGGGYKRYEISAFAKADQEAKHNLNYWSFGDYLGIGAGAHSKLSFHDKIIRQVRYKHPKEYMQKTKTGNHISESNQVLENDLPFEFMMNALRLTNGFANTLFNETTGLPFSKILPMLLKAQEQGLVTLSPTKITPTNRGQDFLNDLLLLFLNG